MVGMLRPLDYIPGCSTINAGIRALDLLVGDQIDSVHRFAVKHLYAYQEPSELARLGRGIITAIPFVNLVTIIYDLAMRLLDLVMSHINKDTHHKKHQINDFIKLLIEFNVCIDRKEYELQRENLWYDYLNLSGPIFGGNNFSELTETQKTTFFTALSKLIFLKSLDLSRCGLSKLPDCMRNLTHLESLDLVVNDFSEVPSCVESYTKLTSLYLSNNQLTTLPEWMKSLTELRTLFLSKNSFEQAPTCIGRLTNLQTLNLSGNKLTQLPEEMRTLNKIIFLDLSSNQFNEVPSCIAALSKLSTLRLGSNPLSDLPDFIGDLPLTLLNLMFISFKQPPTCLARLTNCRVNAGDGSRA